MNTTTSKYVLYIGSALFIAYTLQYALSIRWEWLYTLQIDEMYKRWSGVVVGVFILVQWLLTLIRVVKKWRKYAMKFVVFHKWLGAFSPILLYIHATEFGFGYLALFSYLFFANMLLGVVNLDVIKSKKDWVFQSWMIAHVTFSVVITFLLFFHIGVVFYYK